MYLSIVSPNSTKVKLIQRKAEYAYLLFHKTDSKVNGIYLSITKKKEKTQI